MNLALLRIDRTSNVPVFDQITQLIIKNIEMKILSPGERLPTERDLAEQLRVARGTVKRAYSKLEQDRMIETIQGSGSYVRMDEKLTVKRQRQEAAEMIGATVLRLKSMGLDTAEISDLFQSSLLIQNKKAISVAIIYNNPELLLDFKNQLSYLPDIDLSIFILETITTDINPERLMAGFDLIVVPTSVYPIILEILPEMKNKVIEAAVSPSNETLVEVTSLKRGARIGIICRSNQFLGLVKNTLSSFGFDPEKVNSIFEMDYTTDTYFPGGIDALISFGNAHIFTDAAFEGRNEELLKKGGRIIEFRYQIEKGTLIFIEDRVRRLAEKRK